MDPTSRGALGATSFLPLLGATNWAQGLAPLVVCVVLVLAFSFGAAMVEAAYLALPTARAAALQTSDNAMERSAARIRLDFAKPLAAMVVCNNATNIAGSMLAGFFAK